MKELTQEQIGEYLNSTKDTYLYIHEKEGSTDVAITLAGDMNTLAETLADIMEEHENVAEMVATALLLLKLRDEADQQIIDQAKENGVN
jgi:hypothetical protein